MYGVIELYIYFDSENSGQILRYLRFIINRSKKDPLSFYIYLYIYISGTCNALQKIRYERSKNITMKRNYENQSNLNILW